MTIQLRPNAKINIGLNVLSRREDGFHNIETLFIPLLELHDELAITPFYSVPGITLEVSGEIDTGPVRQNLIVRAYELLAPFSPPAVHVHLHKRIPTGAGLGGGSADAAFFLAHFSRFCEVRPSPYELTELALQLGSDCPFFLYNFPAFGEGRGERLTPVSIACRDYYVLLIMPDIHVPTPWAFSQVQPTERRVPLPSYAESPVKVWNNLIVNDFLRPVVLKYPQISEYLAALRQLGAEFVSLSGSGPSLYGLFCNAPLDYAKHFSNCRVHLQKLVWECEEENKS